MSAEVIDLCSRLSRRPRSWEAQLRFMAVVAEQAWTATDPPINPKVRELWELFQEARREGYRG